MPDAKETDAAHWAAVEEAAELIQEERWADAVVSLGEVIKSDPRNPYAFNHLGAALLELGKRIEARDAFAAAVRLAPDFLGARVALSAALRQLGDAKGALVQANEALRRFPKDREALHAAGLANAAIGNRPQARKHLQGVLDTNPGFEMSDEVRQILEMLGIGGDDEPIEFD